MTQLRKVTIEGYTLETWATPKIDNRGQTVIGYRLTTPQGETLFEAADFCGSPLHADDSDATLRCLLGFLTLKPGDIEAEWFESYTPEQMAFAQSDAETLSWWADDECSEPFQDVDP